MGFKDAIKHDVAETFLNLEEFGEEISLNGIITPALVNGPQTALAPVGDDRPGVVFETVVINYPAGLMPLPRADREIMWNDQKWIVMDSANNAGIHRVQLFRERS